MGMNTYTKEMVGNAVSVDTGALHGAQHQFRLSPLAILRSVSRAMTICAPFARKSVSLAIICGAICANFIAVPARAQASLIVYFANSAV
jgi:hypothetical protein